jgi:hypothetical protein
LFRIFSEKFNKKEIAAGAARGHGPRATEDTESTEETEERERFSLSPE